MGIDTHRTFGEVVIWEDGLLRHAGRIGMTRTALEDFGKDLLATDEVVIEATGNYMAVSRVLTPFVKRVIIANPLQVKAIAHSQAKTDKIDAGTLANLYAAGYLPEIWTPDARTERMRRLVGRRYQVVRHRTRIKNEVHAILYAYLTPHCPHADLFSRVGRAWLLKQPFPDDERIAIERHMRELDRLGEDLAALDKEIAESHPPARRSLSARSHHGANGGHGIECRCAGSYAGLSGGVERMQCAITRVRTAPDACECDGAPPRRAFPCSWCGPAAPRTLSPDLAGDRISSDLRGARRNARQSDQGRRAFGAEPQLKTHTVGRTTTDNKQSFRGKVLSSMRSLQNTPKKIAAFFQKPSLKYAA
jgi:hypothetical protein